MKKYLLYIFLISLPFCQTLAQNREEIKTQINNIKKNKNYIYSDVTAATAEEAIDLAYEYLFENINKWVATQKSFAGTQNIVVNDTKEMWSTLEMERGNMFRAFVYVHKKNLTGANTTDVIKNTNTYNPDDIAYAKRQEAIDELEDGSVNNKEQKLETKGNINSVEFASAAKSLAEIEKYSDAGKLLITMKKQGLVKSYERYENVSDANDYYLIIYNKEGMIKAILSTGPERINVKTKQPDSILNYRGHGATCFKVQ